MCDPATASASLDKPRCKFVGRGALPGPTSEPFATGAGGWQPRFHPLADQVMFKLGEVCKIGCHHSTVRRFEFKPHDSHGNDSDLSSGEFAENVLRRSPPTAERGNQYDIDLSGLRQSHHPIARGTDVCCAGCRFGEYTRHFMAGLRGKFHQIPKLALTRLV
jgi:hypothetical protein